MTGSGFAPRVVLARSATPQRDARSDDAGVRPEARRAFPRNVVSLAVVLAGLLVVVVAPAQAALRSRAGTDPTNPCARLSGSAASECASAVAGCKTAGAYSASVEQTCLQGVEAAFGQGSGSGTTPSPAPSSAAQGCSSLPAAVGSMTKAGVRLVTACLGYLRSGVQKQAADVNDNLHTCTVLESVPHAVWSGMSDVGSAYVSDGQSGNPKIFDPAMKLILDYMDAASSWYERNPSAAPPGIVSAIHGTTAALEDTTTAIRKFDSDLVEVGREFTQAASSHSCSAITAPAATLASDAQGAAGKLDVALAGLASIGSHLPS